MEQLGRMSLQMAALDFIRQDIQHVHRSVIDAVDNSEAKLQVLQLSLANQPDLRTRLCDHLNGTIQELVTDEDHQSGKIQELDIDGDDRSDAVTAWSPPSVSLSSTSRRPRRCRCTSRQERSTRFFGLISTSVRKHDPTCPLHKFATSTDAWFTTVLMPATFRVAGMRFILSTLRGARSSAIHRTLLCCRVLPNDHPAMKLLKI